MGVRLNKVLTELNIGLQTAVDYLKKKNLGEINDATMNTKISDEQYDALVKEFKGDKDVKTQAGMMFPKKEKKAKPEHKPEPAVAQVKEEPKQTFTPLGKIDLNNVGKPNKNVTVDANGKIDFKDKSVTENTRVSYPIEHIEKIVKNVRPISAGPAAKNVIFLSADAFGVLPPVSILTPDPCIYHIYHSSGTVCVFIIYA